MTSLPSRESILDDAIVTSDWKSYYGDIRDYVSLLPFAQVAKEVTIVDNSITVNSSANKILAESNSPTTVDNIKTDGLQDSQLLLLYKGNQEHNISLKNGGVGDGSIATLENKDVPLSMDFPIILQRDGNNWKQIDLMGSMRANDTEFTDGISKVKFPTVAQIKPFIGSSVSAQLGVVVWCMKPAAGCLECNDEEHSGEVYKSLYAELLSGELPSVSYDEYQSQVSSSGFCEYFALDSDNVKFKCPNLSSIKMGETSYKPYVGAFASANQSLVDVQAVLDKCLVVQTQINEKGEEIKVYVEQSISQITQLHESAISDITLSKDSAISDINNEESSAISSISQKEEDSINNIESKRLEILSVGQDEINKLNSLSTSLTNSFNTNATTKTQEFNSIASSAQQNINNSVEDSRKWAVGTIDERPEGSSKYWAEQAQSIVNVGPATTEKAGIARLSSEQDINLTASDTIITPKNLTELPNSDIDMLDNRGRLKYRESSIFNNTSTEIFADESKYTVTSDTFTEEELSKFKSLLKGEFGNYSLYFSSSQNKSATITFNEPIYIDSYVQKGKKTDGTLVDFIYLIYDALRIHKQDGSYTDYDSYSRSITVKDFVTKIEYIAIEEFGPEHDVRQTISITNNSISLKNDVVYYDLEGNERTCTTVSQNFDSGEIHTSLGIINGELTNIQFTHCGSDLRFSKSLETEYYSAVYSRKCDYIQKMESSSEFLSFIMDDLGHYSYNFTNFVYDTDIEILITLSQNAYDFWVDTYRTFEYGTPMRDSLDNKKYSIKASLDNVNWDDIVINGVSQEVSKKTYKYFKYILHSTGKTYNKTNTSSLLKNMYVVPIYTQPVKATYVYCFYNNVTDKLTLKYFDNETKTWKSTIDFALALFIEENNSNNYSNYSSQIFNYNYYSHNKLSIYKKFNKFYRTGKVCQTFIQNRLEQYTSVYQSGLIDSAFIIAPNNRLIFPINIYGNASIDYSYFLINEFGEVFCNEFVWKFITQDTPYGYNHIFIDIYDNLCYIIPQINSSTTKTRDFSDINGYNIGTILQQTIGYIDTSNYIVDYSPYFIKSFHDGTCIIQLRKTFSNTVLLSEGIILPKGLDTYTYYIKALNPSGYYFVETDKELRYFRGKFLKYSDASSYSGDIDVEVTIIGKRAW